MITAYVLTKLAQCKRCLFWLLLSSMAAVNINAQNNFRLTIKPVDTPENVLKELKLKTIFSSATTALLYIKQLPADLAAQGYISASVDSVIQDTSSAEIYLYAGEKFTWQNLFVSSKDQALLQTLGYDKSSFNNRPFDPNKVATLYNNIIDYCVNNGHPFARVSMDSIRIEHKFISAALRVDEGNTYFIDSIKVNGKVKLSSYFLQHQLNIKKGDAYSEAAFNTINARLAELPYISQSQPWDITFLNTGAILNLYLQPKPSNEINVLIGFLPENQELGGKLLLTGEATLNLKNAFGTGEGIGLHWQQLQSKSPRLDLAFQKPYLFKSPFGAEVNFDLYKRDSFFLNISAQLGITYKISAQQNGKLLFQTFRTNLLNVDTLQIKLTRRLPDIADVSSNNIGLQYELNNTNYHYIPRKGNELIFFGSAGKKNIRENNAVLQLQDTGFNYKQLYDSVRLKSYQLTLRLNAAHYIPLGRQATFKTAVNAGIFQSPSYFNNELFQIGGYKLLRGFDEESIYTNRFVVGTLEYRYLLAQNSYFFVFTDAGRASYKSTTVSYVHNYIGIGSGIAFETKTGIFNISYAIGKRDDQKFDFKQSKIHIGFVSLF